jgi:uncharacterized protein YndB with AHSA1/START domain
MGKGLVATASTTVHAPASAVWDALVDPRQIREYMFGTNVVSDWKEGSPIVWKGEWEGKAYEDKGVILRMTPGRVLEYTHFSPLGGQPDKPENYHTVTIELSGSNGTTNVRLSQDNNATEEAKEHSEKNWSMMLGGLKRRLETG